MHKVYQAILDIDILSPPAQYVREILQALCDILGYAFGTVLEAGVDGGRSTFASYQLPVDFPDDASGGDASLLLDDHAVGSGITVITDPRHDPRTTPWHHVCQVHAIQTIISIPLLSYRKPFGACHLFDTQARPLTPDDHEMLSKIGEMVSISVVSNQYLSQLNQRTKELQEEIAERRRAESALRDALRKRKELEEIVNRSPVVVFLWGATKGWPVEFVSRSIEQFGYSPDEMLEGSTPFFSLVHPDDLQRVANEIQEHLDGAHQEFTLEYRLVTRDGSTRWVDNRIWVRRDTDGIDLLHVVTGARGRVTHLQGIIQDITDRKQAEETIWHQAFHDNLTDLPNRVLFQDRLSLALAHARRHKEMLAVMFLDLDRFKSINDTLGHAMGDLLLQQVAERLRSRLREVDTISRLGGDEFTILLPGIKQREDAENVARKILEGFEIPFDLNGSEAHITTSIGLCLFPDDGDDAQTLLKNADTALYFVKEQEKNAYQFFSSTMNAKTSERLSLENNLRHAVERNEFVLHYQPQLEITTGRMIGLESLIRWQHPELGLIPPAQFIPLAEETGLIEPIGEWVLRTVCQQQHQWRTVGLPPMKVAVNISARQFHQSNLVAMVRAVLAETGFDPNLLELEITESVAMRDIDLSVSVMSGLKSMGIRLSMDDFGIGYSSLMYFKQFPINTLKIDRSFINGLTVDPNDEAIATAIIAMARSLRLQVIAEGVETEGQLSFLRRHQCDAMQGYLFSRPMPPDVLERFLRTDSDLERVLRIGQ